jgi:hypothetical protein
MSSTRGDPKDLDEFYTHPRMADGHLNKCKTCTRGDSNKRRTEHPDVVAQYESERSQRVERKDVQREYAQKRDPEQKRATHKRYSESHKVEISARGKVQHALKSGALVRGRCEVCGSYETQAHHEDYTKPLEVRWLCSLHHGEMHRTEHVPVPDSLFD